MRTNFENALAAMISDGWARMSDGDVSTPFGYFSVVEIDGTEETHGYSTDDGDLDSAIFAPEARGVYCVIEDTFGNIFVSAADSIREAEAWYTTRAESFADWVNSF